MSEQLRPKLLKADQAITQSWEWPDLEHQHKIAAETALNQVKHSISEPELIDDEPISSPALPTLEEIEAIRDEAYQDGFAEGREAGEKKGFEQGRLKGIEQGYNEGYQQGIEQGLEAGDKQNTERLAQWDSLLNELISPLQALDEQVERELVTLAMRLAQAVVQVELATSSEAVLEALRLGIQALPSQRQQVEIHLNEQDKLLIQNSFGEEALAQRHWQLLLDPRLKTGSMLLTTERSQVAMLSEDRLQQVLEHFLSRSRDDVVEPSYPHYEPVVEPTEDSQPEAVGSDADNEPAKPSAETTTDQVIFPSSTATTEKPNDHFDPQ